MKIKSIAISNCLSFALQGADPTPNITFKIVGNSGSQHVLVGPNGAGKSNFIEIVSRCFKKALFSRAVLNEQPMMAMQREQYVHEDTLRQVLTFPNETVDWNLRQHDGSGSDLQTIVISIDLNDNDFNNMEFLLSHAEIINAILGKYSKTGITVPTVLFTDLRDHSAITATVNYQTNGNQLNVTFTAEDDPSISFIKSYLRNFQVLQMAITLYNRYIRRPEEPRWPELQQTFAMLSSYRNYAGISSTISVETNRSFQPVYDRLKNESTRSGGGEEPAVFEMVKRKVGYAFHDLYLEDSLTNSLAKLYGTEPLVSINKLLSEYLTLQIKVTKANPIDPTLEMHFEREGKRVETSDLSSGEKGILHFIFTVYGFDLENGVIVIDEPELHLHPQIQKEYQAIINEVSARLDIQFITATHSPLFIGVDTIEQVYRFYKIAGHTEIVQPTITAPQKALAKILDLTNSAKIFFVNHVILVEGETDEYFFRFLLDYLKKTARTAGASPWQEKIKDYEIVNIKGKGQRKVWTEFLEKFGLKVSFIGDWDNIAEVASFNLTKYTDAYVKALATAGGAVQQKGSGDGAALFAAIDKTIADSSAENLKELKDLKDYIAARVTDYLKLITYVKGNDAAEWTRLNAAIESAYTQKVFILKQGELENYLGLSGKGIDQVITFCQNDFASWLTNPVYTSYKDELYEIIRRIVE